MDLKPKHININGDYYSADEPVLKPANRSFCYGDALFETMHAYQDKVQFFEFHYKRILQGMQMLSMRIPEKLSPSYLHDQIISLMRKNRLYKGVRIRLTVYRNDGGYYTPETNEISFLIEATPLESIVYGVQQRGLGMGIFDQMKKPVNVLSSLKTANSLLYVLAGVYKKENNFDDCLLINEKGCIVETISSNIFFVRGNTITTPPLSDGCIPGVMRDQIIRIAKELNFKIDDQSSILPDSIISADEVFVTNAVTGIQWVLGFRDRRFFHDVSASLLIKLNETVFSSM